MERRSGERGRAGDGLRDDRLHVGQRELRVRVAVGGNRAR